MAGYKSIVAFSLKLLDDLSAGWYRKWFPCMVKMWSFSSSAKIVPRLGIPAYGQQDGGVLRPAEDGMPTIRISSLRE